MHRRQFVVTSSRTLIASGLLAWTLNSSRQACATVTKGNNRLLGQGPYLNDAERQQFRLWPTGSTIRIRFLDGTDALKQAVVAHSAAWIQHANLKFEFLGLDAVPADVAISFAGRELSTSSVGTDSIDTVRRGQPSMWLNHLNLDDQDATRRCILHEFGHMLGLLHEHQSPTSGVNYDPAKTIEYYRKQGWDDNKVQDFILRRFAPSESNFTPFDPNSIMMYSVVPLITADGTGFNEPTNLSKNDVEIISWIYPAYPPTGILLRVKNLKTGQYLSVGKPVPDRIYQPAFINHPDINVRQCDSDTGNSERWVLEPSARYGPGFFHIRNASNNRYLDVFFRWKRDGGFVGTAARDDEQAWRLYHIEKGPTYLVQSVISSMFLDVYMGSRVPGGRVGQALSQDQKWEFEVP